MADVFEELFKGLFTEQKRNLAPNLPIQEGEEEKAKMEDVFSQEFEDTKEPTLEIVGFLYFKEGK